MLDVRDGGIVHSAVVNGFPFDCPSACAVPLADGGIPHYSGPVPVDVTAPGYRPLSFVVYVEAVDVDVTPCCKLVYAPQQVDVSLVPL